MTLHTIKSPCFSSEDMTLSLSKQRDHKVLESFLETDTYAGLSPEVTLPQYISFRKEMGDSPISKDANFEKNGNRWQWIVDL